MQYFVDRRGCIFAGDDDDLYLVDVSWEQALERLVTDRERWYRDVIPAISDRSLFRNTS